MKINFFYKNNLPLFWMWLGEVLLLLLCSIALSAQNGVTVTGLMVEAGTVTFNVSWDKNASNMPAVWSDTVWVFVDYNDAGGMKRLPLSAGATLSATSAPGVGKVIIVPKNNQGVWVVGNARSAGNFSATVTLLTTVTDIGGACAYVSNYPPVGNYTSASNISFTGTPGYHIILEKSDGSTYTATHERGVYTIPSGEVIRSFIDKTGAPGIFTCMPPLTYTLSGSDVCLNGTVTLSLSGSQGGWRYQLYREGTAMGSIKEGTGSILTFSETATATGTFGYTVQTVDPTGAQCERPVSSVRSITVQALPATPAVTRVSAATVCQGTSVVFTASSGGTGASYSWAGNPAGTASGTGSCSYTVSGTATGTKSVTVYATAPSGGMNCVSATSGAVTGFVAALPTTPTGASNNARCGSGTVTFSATAPSDCTIDWYTTSSGTAVVSGGSNTTSFSPNLTTTTTYYAQSRNTTTGCISTSRLAVTGTINNSNLSAGAINNGNSMARVGTVPASITSNKAASSSLGGVTYRWVRTGTSSNTYDVNNAGHSFTAAEVNTAGTWTYYREVRDNTCATTTWIRSSGSYVLTVINCPYTGSDLYLTASYPCQQRSSGARNWEAYIRDSRDSEIYRIVLMPDNKWWLAQNVKYAQTGQAVSISGCTPEKCGRYYTAAQKSGSYGGTSGNGSNKQGVCPNGWVLPVFSNWTALFNNISSNTSVVCQRLRALNSPCSPRDNYYGWANQMIVSYSSCASSCNDHWHANDTNGSMQRMDHWSNIGNYCNTLEQCNPGALPMTVRCFRQL